MTGPNEWDWETQPTRVSFANKDDIVVIETEYDSLWVNVNQVSSLITQLQKAMEGRPFAAGDKLLWKDGTVYARQNYMGPFEVVTLSASFVIVKDSNNNEIAVALTTVNESMERVS